MSALSKLVALKLDKNLSALPPNLGAWSTAAQLAVRGALLGARPPLRCAAPPRPCARTGPPRTGLGWSRLPGVDDVVLMTYHVLMSVPRRAETASPTSLPTSPAPTVAPTVAPTLRRLLPDAFTASISYVISGERLG